MLLDDLGDYLTSQGVGTVGTSIFLGDLPPQAVQDDVLTLIETGGMATLQTMSTGPGTASVERPRVQVIARSCQFCRQQARNTANQAFLALDGFRSRTINGTLYHWMQAVQSPFYLQTDENNRPLVVFNLDVWKAISTSTSTGAI